MFAASILILLALPWLDTSRVRSGSYRPIFKQFFWVFVIVCVALGYLGSKPAGGRLCDLVAHSDGLLLPALPGDPAADRTSREPEAAAAIDCRRGAGQEEACGRACRVIGGKTMKMLKTLAIAGSVLAALAGGAMAAEGQKPAKDIAFSFEGPFGHFDRAQLQRGYKVYKDTCSGCHSMNSCRSAIWRNTAGRSSAKNRSRRWRRRSRCRTDPTPKAKCSNALACRRTVSRHHTRTRGCGLRQWRRGSARSVADHQVAGRMVWHLQSIGERHRRAGVRLLGADWL